MQASQPALLAGQHLVLQAPNPEGRMPEAAVTDRAIGQQHGIALLVADIDNLRVEEVPSRDVPLPGPHHFLDDIADVDFQRLPGIPGRRFRREIAQCRKSLFGQHC